MSSLVSSNTVTTSYPIIDYGSLTVQLLPSHDDNYAYLIIDSSHQHAAIVDVSDLTAIEHGLQWRFQQLKLQGKSIPTLQYILTTHKHWDHAGGNEEFVRSHPGIAVLGSAVDQVPGCTQPVKAGDIIPFGHMTIRIFESPCHTRGHVLYLFESNTNQSQPLSKSVLFTGDTLFLAGAGKFFEGNANEMYHNLVNTIGSMPGDTEFYPGHEYTVSNLEFAMWMEPGNEDIQRALEEARDKRKHGKATVPGTIEREKQTNPFMRVGESINVLSVLRDRVKSFLPIDAPVQSDVESRIAVLHAIREAKNAGIHQKK